jgi:hypothetical protein
MIDRRKAMLGRIKSFAASGEGEGFTVSGQMTGTWQAQ